MAPKEVRRLRQRLGLTQVELAQRLDLNKMTVSRWERGLVPIPKATAELLKLWAKQPRKER
jgi:DNA-binding transcriptional regulator YiaG